MENRNSFQIGAITKITTSIYYLNDLKNSEKYSIVLFSFAFLLSFAGFSPVLPIQFLIYSNLGKKLEILLIQKQKQFASILIFIFACSNLIATYVQGKTVMKILQKFKIAFFLIVLSFLLFNISLYYHLYYSMNQLKMNHLIQIAPYITVCMCGISNSFYQVLHAIYISNFMNPENQQSQIKSYWKIVSFSDILGFLVFYISIYIDNAVYYLYSNICMQIIALFLIIFLNEGDQIVIDNIVSIKQQDKFQEILDPNIINFEEIYEDHFESDSFSQKNNSMNRSFESLRTSWNNFRSTSVYIINQCQKNNHIQTIVSSSILQATINSYLYFFLPNFLYENAKQNNITDHHQINNRLCYVYIACSTFKALFLFTKTSKSIMKKSNIDHSINDILQQFGTSIGKYLFISYILQIYIIINIILSNILNNYVIFIQSNQQLIKIQNKKNFYNQNYNCDSQYQIILVLSCVAYNYNIYFFFILSAFGTGICHILTQVLLYQQIYESKQIFYKNMRYIRLFNGLILTLCIFVGLIQHKVHPFMFIFMYASFIFVIWYLKFKSGQQLTENLLQSEQTIELYKNVQ